MTVTVISTNTFVGGVAYTPTVAGDDLYVLPNFTLMSTGTAGASINLSNVTLQIDGTLAALDRAVTFDTSGTFGRLDVGATGTVRSFIPNSNDAGIVFFGANGGVTNHGTITAPEAICVFLGGTNGDILNTGLITGTTGVQMASGSTGSRLVNYGTITGSNQFDGTIEFFEGRGVVVQSTNAYVLNGAIGVIGSTATGGSGLMATGFSGGLVFETFGDVWATSGIGIDLGNVSGGQSLIRVANHGTVSGMNGAYLGSVNADALTNRGDLNGTVLLGDGADTFDNRRGTVEGDVDLGAGDDTFDTRGGLVTGEILGGAGNDRIVSNAFEDEVVFGGEGTADMLDFRYGSGVIVALDGSFDGAGAAQGDSYFEFENVIGSGVGADTIRGNGAANNLNSGGGNDVLDGADGGDLLRGGEGRDTLTGGNGNDTFRFMDLVDAGDVITDFSSSAVGNNDRFQFSAAGFGAGLIAGALAAGQFQSRADNLAQDADDRFIFRTTDKTLWFDADGVGAGAALMIADMQASATMTAADIVIL